MLGWPTTNSQILIVYANGLVTKHNREVGNFDTYSFQLLYHFDIKHLIISASDKSGTLITKYSKPNVNMNSFYISQRGIMDDKLKVTTCRKY